MTGPTREETNSSDKREILEYVYFSVYKIDFIKWGLFGCQIVCDYGFISSGEHVFPCSNEHPTCVQTMAFIIGR